MSFETNLKEAHDILEKLNDEELSLSESVKLYKKGLKFIDEARQILEKAKLEIKEVDE